MTESASGQLALALCRMVESGLRSSAVEAAKARLLHGLGVSLGGANVPAAITAWNAVARDAGACLALGRSSRVTAAAAAFANGVLGHCSLQEDTSLGAMEGGGHPGTYVIPAALAAAENVGASGAALISGIVLGYEAVDRLCRATPPGVLQRNFRTVPLMGPFGAATAAAMIYGANEAQLSTAIAIAANAAGGLKQGLFDGTIEPYLHAGFAARDGLLAADLAIAGAVASVNELEGEFGFFETFGGSAGDVDALYREAAEPAVCRIGIKPFPSCLENQETMALILRNSPNDLRGTDIQRVTLYRSASGRNGIHVPGVASVEPCKNTLQAQLSARFTAAASLMRRPVDDIRYFLAAVHDAEVMDLAERVDIAVTSDDGVAVDVILQGGRNLEFRGDTSSTLFPAAREIRERFTERGAAILGKDQAQRVAALIDSLETISDVRELTLMLSNGSPD